jgi:broad specificity phosphatase PhoE
VGPGPIGTIRPHTVLLVEATSPAVLLAHPQREGTLSGCTRALDRRIHQGGSRAPPCNLFRDVDAAEFGGLGGDIGVGTRQHVRVADDTTSQLRDEDGRAKRKLGQPFGEVGGGFLHRQGFQVRLRQEIAVAPSARGDAHLCDGSGVTQSCLPNDDLASHEHSVDRGMDWERGSRFRSEPTPFGDVASRHKVLPGSVSRVSLRRMDRLIVARHAESEYNVRGLIDAEPSSRRSPLSDRGRDQARSLADRLAGDDVDLCVTSGTLRAVQTGQVVANSLSIPLLKTPLLDDPPAGIFEGGPVDAFATWMREHDPDTPVPGTSATLRDSARRYLDAAWFLLDRPERTVLVVAHAPALRWIVQAALGRTDSLDYSSPLFAYADPAEVDVRALRSKLDKLVSDPFDVLSGRANG